MKKFILIVAILFLILFGATLYLNKILLPKRIKSLIVSTLAEQKGITEVYRGHKETGNLLRKIRLEIAVNDNFVEPTIKAIEKGAKTGSTGDGKIFVLDLKECVRIRTEERGTVAIG